MVTLINTLERVADGAARPRHPEKAHRPDAPVLKKPDWIRVRAPGSPVWAETRDIVRENKLVTVCEEAGCPNIGECWSKKHASFMILGDTCTRACAFCNVRTGLPGAVDGNEPENIANAVANLTVVQLAESARDRATVVNVTNTVSTPSAALLAALDDGADKSPGVALILSILLVGLGQLYNGQIGKGLLMFIGSVLLWAVLLGWTVWLWSVFDAYSVAKKLRTAHRRRLAVLAAA